MTIHHSNSNNTCIPRLLDCTLRDGGYYTSWDFTPELVHNYLQTMHNVGISSVELGFRSLINHGFKGAHAYTTDSYISSLNIPDSLSIGVMINASEILGLADVDEGLEKLFPHGTNYSQVRFVRVACHYSEFIEALPISIWLKNMGYKVAFNIMQIDFCSENQIIELATKARPYPIDTLYFADSMGSMNPTRVAYVVSSLRSVWDRDMGIHTHNNMGLALQNSLKAVDEGVTWVDSTVTGMGRGAGNALTEELIFEISKQQGSVFDWIPLMNLRERFFLPLQEKFRWGTNPYYYLSGLYGIHPTYIQQMLGDTRYNSEDIIAVINHLKNNESDKFNLNTLDAARHYYGGSTAGNWSPESVLKSRDLLILGSGPGISLHKTAIESYIERNKPIVIALNTQHIINADFVDYHIACHPIRLLADADEHRRMGKPLIAPVSMLPGKVREALEDKILLDYGMSVEENTFEIYATHSVLPSSLVVIYALAVATAGKAERVLMAGFDGYGIGDSRSIEMQELIVEYQQHPDAIPLLSVTPTLYSIPTQSIYAM